jgi:hypothetical protein
MAAVFAAPLTAEQPDSKSESLKTTPIKNLLFHFGFDAG